MREIATLGGDVGRLVSPTVLAALQARLGRQHALHKSPRRLHCGLGQSAALQILAIATAIAAVCALQPIPIRSAACRSIRAGIPSPSFCMKRYQALAADIERSIRTGVLQPGDRLPSVRHTLPEPGVSASTVFQAYYQLEAQGLVRARERSGYYVSDGAAQRLPSQSTLPSRPMPASPWM